MTRDGTTAAGAGARSRVEALCEARSEDGWALVISLIVMVVMLGFGLALVSIADTQSSLGSKSRQRDAALSVADAALNAEMFMLGNNWPGQGAVNNQFPVCTPATTDQRCPSATMLSNLINDPDTASNMSWQINVYDNNAQASLQSFYSDAYASGQPSYDQNNDKKLWVRAQATVGTVTKVVVALVQAQPFITALPRAVIVAGSVQVTNSGNKTMINTQGQSPSPAGDIAVRCTPITPSLSNPCLTWDPTKSQVAPFTNATTAQAGSYLSSSIQTALKNEAIANGTYYDTCPASPPSGAVVWIDSGACHWLANGSLNSSQQPGLMVLNKATVNFDGTLQYYGLVYALNNPDPTVSRTVVTTSGNAQIFGAVFVDGNGIVAGGSSKLNVTFDANALGTVSTIANVNYIQSTWRAL